MFLLTPLALSFTLLWKNTTLGTAKIPKDLLFPKPYLLGVSREGE